MALTVIFLLLMAGTAGAYYVWTGKPPSAFVTGPSSSSPSGRTNVLLMGTDARAGEPSQRTDTMILCSIDPASRQVALLSIPRDTRVDLPGHGLDKINDADVYGGPDEAMAVAGNLLGVDINYYVLADFNGFKDIVDTLGGVTVDVKSNMYHYDPMDGGIYTIDLKKGVQVLDGTKALEFVRFRDDALGDIDRTARQQEFLTALVKKMMQPSSLTKLPALAPEVMRDVHTNLPLAMVVSLARTAAGIDNLQVVRQTLPGYFATIGGISYWVVDPDQARAVAAAVLNGRTTARVVLDTPPGVSEDTYAAPKGVTGSTYGSPPKQGVPPAATPDNGNTGSGPAQGSLAPGGDKGLPAAGATVPGARVTFGPSRTGPGVQ